MRRAALVACLMLSAACAGRSAPVAPPATVDEAARLAPRDRLDTALTQIFQAPALEHANWGIKIESLRTGETLYSYNAFKLLLPASNQKLVTTAVAAGRLGWDYRFTTRLVATGPLDATGTLDGDLVVIGNGDPTINPRHGDRGRLFDQWAVALRRGGVHAISGRIIGDDNAFAEPGLGEGWTWENLPYGFGTAIGALQFNENQFVVRVAPGLPGNKPILSAAPETHGLLIQNDAITAAAGARSTIDIARLVGSKLLRVTGEIAADSTPLNITASVDNPTTFYVSSLKAALVASGIEVRGEAVDIDDVSPHAPLAGSDLLVDQSPPLFESVDVCLKWSRNDYAETLLRAVAPTLPSTPRASLDVVQSQLATWGIPARFIVPLDGSGLSRQDYVTAHGLNLLLTHIWRDPGLADTFRSTLPLGGLSGTLADRMKGTVLEGRVWAKTGTLNSVRSLSGYFVTRAGEPLVFSMLSNNFQVPAADVDAAMESALLHLYEWPHLH